jgi:hypothetical protein
MEVGISVFMRISGRWLHVHGNGSSQETSTVSNLGAQEAAENTKIVNASASRGVSCCWHLNERLALRSSVESCTGWIPDLSLPIQVPVG